MKELHITGLIVVLTAGIFSSTLYKSYKLKIGCYFKNFKCICELITLHYAVTADIGFKVHIQIFG